MTSCVKPYMVAYWQLWWMYIALCIRPDKV